MFVMSLSNSIQFIKLIQTWDANLDLKSHKETAHPLVT